MTTAEHDKVRAVFAELLERRGDNRPFADDELLMTQARLDSVDVLELASFLESSFGIDFSVRQFDQAIFDSVESVVRFVVNGR